MNTEVFVRAIRNTPDREVPNLRRVYADWLEERGECRWAEDQRQAAVDAETKWHYTGDVNLECGGMFIDISEWKWGYASVVRVEDWESATGFTGTVLIEELTVNTRTSDVRRAIRYFDSPAWSKYGKTTSCLVIVVALVAYGSYDRDGQGTIVQMDPDGPMEFDGSKADVRLRGGDLRGYVTAKFLRE